MEERRGIDTARHRQETREEATRLGKLLSHTEAYRILRSDSRTDARRTKTCVAPRHVDAPCDFYLFCFFLSITLKITSSAGECAARLFFFFFFSVQQTTSERDWSPYEVYFGLATNTMNM